MGFILINLKEQDENLVISFSKIFRCELPIDKDIFLLAFKTFILIVCIYVLCLYVCICTVYMPGASKGQRRDLDPLGPESQPSRCKLP